MGYLEAVILSFVEGLTEFLPVSSTGHLVLSSKLLGIPQTEFVKSFEIIIQLGAILAVVFLYWKMIWGNRKVWRPVIFAFIPTAFVGLLLYKIIKNFLLGNPLITVWALLIGGVVMIGVEYWVKGRKVDIKKIEEITAKKAIIIGLFQSLAIIPGVSRSASTIIGAMILKTDRRIAVEFSFLLAIPTMAAATGLDLIKSNLSFTNTEWVVLGVGFVGSFIVAILAVKFFLKFIQNHTFIPFGIYRILLSIIFYISFLR